MEVNTKTLRQWASKGGFDETRITELGGGHLELATSTVGMPYSKLNLHRDCAKRLYLLLGEVLLSTEGEAEREKYGKCQGVLSNNCCKG